MNKYSIILPVKNGGYHAKECIKSILTQTYLQFNLVILDNCSSDDTISWVKGLNDQRVMIYNASQPLRMEDNWARIINLDKNEFMTIIGHDDLLHPDYLETMDSLIREDPGASLYQTHFRYIDSAGKLVRHCQPMAAKQFAHEFLACQMNQTLDSTGTGYMMRSKDYDSVGGISPLYLNLIFADYELWMKMIKISYKATAKAETFSYRLHDSLSRLTNGEEYQQAFGRYMLFLAALKGTDPAISATIEQYGKKMLLYFCESLSHRLLKTPLNLRQTTVGNFINKCRHYASLLLPGQRFCPLCKVRIFAAWALDNPLGLTVFKVFKKLYPGKRP